MENANRDDGEHGSSSHHYVQAPPPPEAEEENQENEDGAGGAASPDHEGQHVCDTCGAVYPTEKAMFGHLRCHKDRRWRGAYCPPSFSMDEFAQYREHLVKSEEEQLLEIEGEGGSVRRLHLWGVAAAPHAPPPPPRPRREIGAPPAAVWELDLNAPPEEEELDEEEEDGRRHNMIDLNLPPSDEE